MDYINVTRRMFGLVPSLLGVIITVTWTLQYLGFLGHRFVHNMSSPSECFEALTSRPVSQSAQLHAGMPPCRFSATYSSYRIFRLKTKSYTLFFLSVCKVVMRLSLLDLNRQKKNTLFFFRRQRVLLIKIKTKKKTLCGWSQGLAQTNYRA